MSEENVSDKRLELAYSAAQQRLTLQEGTLSNTRSRATTLLSTTALFISFSAGVGLINTDPKKGAVFPLCFAVLLLLVVIGLGFSVLFVLWPAKNWCYVPSASVILEKTDAGESEDEIRRHVIEKMIAGAVDNGEMLKSKQNAFRLSAVLLVVEIILLVGALIIELSN